MMQSVTAVGGVVGVENFTSGGARFSVYVPLDEGNPKNTRAKSPVVVLLVEDEEDVRQFAEQTLLDEGYLVLRASSAEEAIRVACRRAQPVDLALLDVSLPGMDGVAHAEHLLSQRLVRRVLFATPHAGELNGATAALLKPFGREELVRFVYEARDARLDH